MRRLSRKEDEELLKFFVLFVCSAGTKKPSSERKVAREA